jgi:hypothetical protein
MEMIPGLITSEVSNLLASEHFTNLLDKRGEEAKQSFLQSAN